VREFVDSILVSFIDPGQPDVLTSSRELPNEFRANSVWKTLLSGREAWEIVGFLWKYAGYLSKSQTLQIR